MKFGNGVYYKNLVSKQEFREIGSETVALLKGVSEILLAFSTFQSGLDNIR